MVLILTSAPYTSLARLRQHSQFITNKLQVRIRTTLSVLFFNLMVNISASKKPPKQIGLYRTGGTLLHTLVLFCMFTRLQEVA